MNIWTLDTVEVSSTTDMESLLYSSLPVIKASGREIMKKLRRKEKTYRWWLGRRIDFASLIRIAKLRVNSCRNSVVPNNKWL
ncbi:hypothetical protein V1477_008550 [Vespula maculifrons]|uniref:Uncharacterized protein n=1 Tax=Vespula maculifrons TaxID=7453 RepID=A0ABD2CDC5_VESMC